MTTKPVKTTKATKAAKPAIVKPTKATNAGTTTKPRTPRAKKTTPAVPVVTTFPAAMLGYLEIALEGPLGPGGIAHRAKRYPVTITTPYGRRTTDYLIGAACQPTTTRPGPDTNADTGKPAEETIPTVVCREHSAAWVQARGATRCTNDKCWPVQPSETEGSQQ